MDDNDYDDIDREHDARIRDEIDAASAAIMFDIVSAVRATWADEVSVSTAARELVEKHDPAFALAHCLVIIDNLAKDIFEVGDAMQLNEFVFNDFAVSE